MNKKSAPDFKIPSSNNSEFQLKKSKNQFIVIYFYPKDNTPGCTNEAKDFAKLYKEFKKLNCEIVGISKDSIESHKKFINKFKIPFQLLSDEKMIALKKYGAWGEKSMYGKKFMGIKRTTILINPKGKSAKLIKQVISKIRFNEGSKVLLKTLNKNGYHTSLVTGGFQPISTYVGKFLGFKKVISNRFVIKKNKFTGEYIPITGKQNSKLVYLNEICKKKKLNKYKDAICIGDGANDLGMLQNSGLGIGYYPHSIVKKAVDNNIQFTDLKTILFYLGFTEKEFSK